MVNAARQDPACDVPGLDVVMDDAALWPSFGRRLAEHGTAWESRMAVTGMHCAGCALAIEHTLGALPGVAGVAVQPSRQTVHVQWDSAATLPSQWVAALRPLGYTLLPAEDPGVEAARRREARLLLWRWLVSIFCMMQVMMYAWPAYTAAPGDLATDQAHLLRWASCVLTLPVIAFCCAPFFGAAWRALRQRRIGMDLPVSLGIGIAFAVSTAATFDPAGPFGAEAYFDSVTMFVCFLLTGRWLEARLRDRTAGALEALARRLPDTCERRRAGGAWEWVAPARLAAGDTVRVPAGGRFPADAVLVEGATRVDEALLTGESRALARGPGAEVLAGSHNLGAPVVVRVTRTGDATRYAQVVVLIDSAGTHKPRLARAADRFARPFLAVVLVAAACAAAWAWPQGPAVALMTAAAVLVVTCPCALSLATPAALLAAAGALARRGILLRRLDAFEALAAIDTLVFDKTGTLTRDGMAVAAPRVRAGADSADVWALAASLAQQSLHPVARAVAAAAGERPVRALLRCREIAGAGVEADTADGRVRLGSARFCDAPDAEPAAGSAVHLADARGWLATFALDEAVRGDAPATVARLRARGIGVHILSGDAPAAVARIAAPLGICDARGGCSPADKLAAVQAMQRQGRRVAMVGDGLNDGPVLAAATASFAFGRAVPLAQARADFVVLGDRLGDVADTIDMARRALRTVHQSLAWAAGYNAVCVPLTMAGWLPAWLAGLGMAASSLLVVANAARLSRPAAGTPTAQRPLPQAVQPA